jgi:GNAT superfamily N-acetyltransferase
MLMRKYESEDRAACLAIFESNLPQYFDPSERADLETWLNGQDQGVLAYKNTSAERYYVLESDNAIVACGGYYLAKTASRANLCWGMVDGASHLKGFGRQLLEFRLQEIESKFPDYSISMDTSQHTIPFFEKMGFVVVKITPNGYGAGLDRYDLVKTAVPDPKF